MGDIKMGIIIGLIVFTGIILAVNYEDILYYVNYQKYHSPTLESGICDTEPLDEPVEFETYTVPTFNGDNDEWYLDA